MNRQTEVTTLRMHFLTNLSLGLALLAAAAATAHATPITFTETFTGDGFFGPDDPFEGPSYTLTNAPVTFTGTGDTSAIKHNGSEYDLNLSSAAVSVGVGENLLTFQNTIITANLTDPIEVIVTNQFEFAGFEDSDQAEIVTNNSAFSTYNLVGPVTVTGNPGFHSGYEFATSAGSLFLNGTTGDSTFAAVTSNTAVTPEPSTVTMVGSSLLLGLAGMVRRRMRQV